MFKVNCLVHFVRGLMRDLQGRLFRLLLIKILGEYTNRCSSFNRRGSPPKKNVDVSIQIDVAINEFNVNSSLVVRT
jgi:hypothetical protein